MNTHFEAVNLRLHVIHSFIGTREGACSVCGLPAHLAGLMIVPGVLGHFCCIECVECRLFGPGKCRWCGFALKPNQGTFCSPKCRASNDSSPFGSGQRLAMWFCRHNPRLYAKLVGTEIPSGLACLNCAESLDGKRRDSLFCTVNCQHRFNRSHNNPRRGDYPEERAQSQCIDRSHYMSQPACHT
jgi:hypothetical protein